MIQAISEAMRLILKLNGMEDYRSKLTLKNCYEITSLAIVIYAFKLMRSSKDQYRVFKILKNKAHENFL